MATLQEHPGHGVFDWLLSSHPLLILFTLSIAFLFAYAAVCKPRRSEVSVINAFPRDWSNKKAHAEFLAHARSLLVKGRQKYNGPFRIMTPMGNRVILPPSYTDWVRNCKDLSHPAIVRDEFLTAYPGFEGIRVVTDTPLLNDVAKKNMSTNMKFIDTMHSHVIECLEEAWTADSDWHTIDWTAHAVKLTGRMSSSVFVGSELSRDAEWQELTITYAVNLFQAVRALRAIPARLRPVLHWFLPECKKARHHVRNTRARLQQILDERSRHLQDGHSERLEDGITWLQDAAKGRPYDPVAGQLGFAAAALHTTTELLKQCVIDLARHPDLFESLREEVNNAIAESGWSTAGLFKMQLLDSMIKETQRLKPGSLVNLERRTLTDVTLPNGHVLPAGTNLAVDSSAMWDPEHYSNPEKFDAYRFLRLRKEGDGSAQLVSTNNQHIAFGMGKYICPGRFLAANEVKIALAEMVLGYDIRLPQGSEAKVVEYGFEMLSDPMARLEVRRRR